MWEPAGKLRRWFPIPKELLLMRIAATTAALALGLALAACNQADQHKTDADTRAAAQDVKTTTEAAGNDVAADAKKVGTDVKASAEDARADIKKIANDPDVKKAQGELKSALKDLGASVKEAAKKEKHHDDSGEHASNDNG
jgi:FlaG/FlaF family flagellin (archaellin)